MEVGGKLCTLTTLPPGKSPWYLLDRRLGGPQSQPECGGKEKNYQPLPELKPPINQSVGWPPKLV